MILFDIERLQNKVLLDYDKYECATEKKHVSNCVWKADGELWLDHDVWAQSNNQVDGLLHCDTLHLYC